ncbi:MAG: flagellar filament capping protein FliD, partial [Dehalococcoidia bacterium]
SNRVTDVIEGVTLTLKKTTATPVEVAIGNDQEASRALVDQFVTAYNALNSVITEQTRYDAASKIAGTLQGNSIAVRIQQQLRSQVSTNSAADTTGSLSSAGFKIARDSSLSIDEAGMAALLADPARLKTLFSGKAASGDQPATGIARLLDAQLATFLDANGAVTGATDALRARQGAIEKQQERFEDRMVDVEARLTRQYSALDVNLAKITNSFAAIQSLLPKE